MAALLLWTNFIVCFRSLLPFTVFSSIGKPSQLKRLELLSHCCRGNLAISATSSCLYSLTTQQAWVLLS